MITNQDYSTASRARVSAVVVSYNRAHLIEAVLQAVQFCDEVVLVDKSSTDATCAIAAPLCDKIIRVPWSPTVEETRKEAIAAAANDWVVMLDDDEILNTAAVAWIEKELEAPRARIYGLLQHHYIIGEHDPDAYYWPEHQIRFFDRRAVSFTDTVHGGIQTNGHDVYWVNVATNVGMEHLSHPDVTTWIEKANRYTSRPDRVRPGLETEDLLVFVQERIAHWVGRSQIRRPGDYPQAVAILRATYDIIDRLKVWEELRGVSGEELFAKRAAELLNEHRAFRSGKVHVRRSEIVAMDVAADAPQQTVVGNNSVSGSVELQKKVDLLTKRANFLDGEAKFWKDKVHEDENTLKLLLAQRDGEIERFKNMLLVRLQVFLTSCVKRNAGIYWLVTRSLKALRLLRQGRLGGHIVDYVRYKRRVYREHRDALQYKKACLAKIDPDGILNSLDISHIPINIHKLNFPVFEKPVVSIIIPCYGKLDYTLRCLYSLSQALPNTPFEIIIAEDASGEEECKKLAGVHGITYIDRKENMGFLRSCNDAAKRARGDYIFLLNNDTYVMRDAIDALVRLLRERPDAGMVGSRLIYPDGIQQEAGGIVWQDGSAWNYGRGDAPFKSEYCYVREADYISGAAIMLSRDLWNKLGGFDEHYLPAYCEDSDLAFRVRRAGLKVLYQPESWIVHCEGVSHGTDVNSGIKAHQVENSRKLRERWKETLAQDHFPSGAHIMRARDKSMGKKVTLIIDHYLPEPDCDAGSRTMISIIDQLLKMGRVVKFWPDNGRATPRYTELLQQRGVEVLYGAATGSFTCWIKANGGEINEVLLSRPTVAPSYIPLLRKYTQAPIVFYGHDLHHARMLLEAEVEKDNSIKADALSMKEQEISVWKNVDYTLYPSAEEIETVQTISPDVHAGVISPYAFASTKPRTPPGFSDVDIIFVAGFAHTPNVDGALWFYNNVLPLIKAKKPEIRLAFVGSKPAEKVKALASHNVKVTGFVSDAELANYYATARVAIAPLRFGAGVKLKVVEGMHAGIPLVTTSVGAQGLKGLNGALEVCDDPEAFAKAVLRFLDDDSAWQERSMLQVNYVNQNFSSERQNIDLQTAFIKAAKNRSDMK